MAKEECNCEGCGKPHIRIGIKPGDFEEWQGGCIFECFRISAETLGIADEPVKVMVCNEESSPVKSLATRDGSTEMLDESSAYTINRFIDDNTIYVVMNRQQLGDDNDRLWIRAMTHEMVHVKQMIRDGLEAKEDFFGNLQSWYKGEVYPTHIVALAKSSKRPDLLPWEEEAYRKGDEIAKIVLDGVNVVATDALKAEKIGGAEASLDVIEKAVADRYAA